MLEEDGRDFNERWGYLSRAGLNDKSQFTRQIEKYADIYTSRVSNFLRYTPYSYFRCFPAGQLLCPIALTKRRSHELLSSTSACMISSN